MVKYLSKLASIKNLIWNETDTAATQVTKSLTQKVKQSSFTVIIISTNINKTCRLLARYWKILFFNSDGSRFATYLFNFSKLSFFSITSKPNIFIFPLSEAKKKKTTENQLSCYKHFRLTCGSYLRNLFFSVFFFSIKTES